MDYDPALKQILTFVNSRMVERLAGAPVRSWLNVELQETTVRRADLLAELDNGELFHLELQSANFPRMGKRMLDYRLLIEKKYGRVPWQMVLYVGMEPLAMTGVLEERDLTFRFGVMDIRQFDARVLLESPAIEDRILAMLGGVESPLRTARAALRQIATMPQPEREEALAKLLILSGLRRIHDVLRQEVKQMPLFEHPLENPFLRGLYEEGKADEARRYTIHILEHRFGPLPEWAREKIQATPNDQLEALLDRVLDAPDLGSALGS